MHKNSRIRKFLFADGTPAIDVDPFDYSNRGIKYAFKLLAKKYSFSEPKIVSDNYQQVFAELTLEGKQVCIDMDNYGYSISCSDLNLLDEIYDLFLNLGHQGF